MSDLTCLPRQRYETRITALHHEIHSAHDPSLYFASL